MNNPTSTVIHDPGNGLILHHSTREDTGPLAAFKSMIHSDDSPDILDERVGAWMCDLLTRPHPTFPKKASSVMFVN
jgi:hypothetical protein